MSKKSRRIRAANQSLPHFTATSSTAESNDLSGSLGIDEASSTSPSAPILSTHGNFQNGFLTKIKRNWLVVGIIAFVVLGTLGAGLKYLDEDAKSELAKRNAATPLNSVKNESLLNAVNPFLPAPSPTATPQLAKEYIYAGSRLLAVEDANANAAPPADLAVWRPSNGTWYVMGSSGVLQASGTWGQALDEPVPGDYDGDGKTDFSIFRPSSSTWWIMKSSDNTFYSVAFGQANDKIAQADYDGDGRTDPAVFRDTGAGLGTWYIERSSSGFYSYQFGLASDKPAPADYDGDGRADLGVWRNSDTTFYAVSSSTNTLAVTALTQSSSEPVPADYDGDGKADHAIRNANDWIIRKSSNNSTDTIAWQTGADRAVHNDYDGDGKVDIAVWKANGDWFIRKSSNNQTRQESWGTAGDIPVPAYYRR